MAFMESVNSDILDLDAEAEAGIDMGYIGGDAESGNSRARDICEES